MELVVHADHMTFGGGVHLHTERRLRFALYRFRDEVSRVSVLVESEDASVACRMVAVLGPSHRVVAEHRGGADAYASVDAAARELAEKLDAELRPAPGGGRGPSPLSA